MSKQRSNSQKIFKGISSQTLVTISLGLVEVIAFSFMSRLLTKEDFGYFAAISAVYAVFSSISTAGIGASIVQCKDLTPKYINNAFTLSLMFGGGSALVLFLSSGFLAKAVIDERMTVPLMAMSITLLLHSVSSVNINQMIRRLEFLKIGAINLTTLIVSSSLCIFLAWKGFGYYSIVIKVVFQSFLSLALTTYFAKARYRIDFDKQMAKRIFGFSGWLMASAIFRDIAHQIDKLLMGRLLSVQALGAYNRPKDFMLNITSRLNGIFDSALFPVLSSIQDDLTKLGRAYKNSLFIMNAFSVALALAFIVNSELFIRIFLGEKWMSLKTITQILAIATLFNINGRLADCYLRSLGLTRIQFRFRIAETLSNILAVTIGSRWDVLGVAIGFVTANTIMKVFKILFIAHKVKIPLTDALLLMLSSWRYTLVILPICAIPYFLTPSNWLGNIITAVVFTLTCIVVFVRFPSLVGESYEKEIHGKMMGAIRKKFGR